MRARVAIIALLAIACGRIGFDHPGAGSSRDDDAVGDGDGTNPPGDALIDVPIVDGPGVRCVSGNCTYSNDTTAYCDSPGCQLTCTGASNCDFACTAPCTINCDNASTCRFACTGGGCTIHVDSGSDLTGTCTSGCNLTCSATAGPPCKQTCQVPATCTCTGPSCS